MPIEPNYDKRYVQIKVSPDTHKQLRETAENEFGSEQVPWSIVISEALEQFERDSSKGPATVQYEV